jgi:hypothetical protein
MIRAIDNIESDEEMLTDAFTLHSGAPGLAVGVLWSFPQRYRAQRYRVLILHS